MAESAQSLLTLLQQRGDDSTASEVESAMAAASDAGAPSLVRQLSQGHKLARRAALQIDKLAQHSVAARAQIVKLGAVPRLVRLVRNGPHDMGTLNALGALEVLAHGSVAVQDEARVAGIFPALLPLLRPGVEPPPDDNDEPRDDDDGAGVGTTGEGGDDDDGGSESPPSPAPPEARPDATELRCCAALCLCALVQGNKVSREAAKAAGAVEAAATLLDGDHEWKGAYLAAMAMHALGLSDQKKQEAALAERGFANAPATASRVGTLHKVWQLKSEPERWRR